MSDVVDFLEVNTQDKNIHTFNELKKSYSSLENIQIQQNDLVFPEGKVSLHEIDLSLISPTIFEMAPSDLYIYFSNGFYKHVEMDYNKDIDKVFALFLQIIITEDDEIFLKRFAYDFWLRLALYNSEPSLADDEEYTKELLARRKVITESYRSSSLAATLITSTYNQNLQESMVTTNKNDNSSNSNSQTNGMGITLVRNKSSVPKLIDDEQIDNNFGIAGFASILLIIGSTLALGLFIGITFLK